MLEQSWQSNLILSNEKEMTEAFDQVASKFGKNWTFLVNNAAILYSRHRNRDAQLQTLKSPLQ
jgi:NAD(P)-dependent dehydrogenase (short-subunit alcohol dehydrogenase family)